MESIKFNFEPWESPGKDREKSMQAEIFRIAVIIQREFPDGSATIRERLSELNAQREAFFGGLNKIALGKWRQENSKLPSPSQSALTVRDVMNREKSRARPSFNRLEKLFYAGLDMDYDGGKDGQVVPMSSQALDKKLRDAAVAGESQRRIRGRAIGKAAIVMADFIENEFMYPDEACVKPLIEFIDAMHEVLAGYSSGRCDDTDLYLISGFSRARVKEPVEVSDDEE